MTFKVTEQEFNDLRTLAAKQEAAIALINSNPLLLNQGSPQLPIINIPQSINTLRNGSYSHSVGSWANSATADNRRYECAWWYSHPNVANQPMYLNTSVTPATLTFTDTDVNTGTDTITIAANKLVTGLGFTFTSTSPPSPLVTATVYFIISTGANTFKLATTYANALAGTAINLTTAGGAVTNTLSYDYTLKSDLNTLYAPEFSIWDLDDAFPGTASINQGYTLDAPIVGEEATAVAGYTLYGVINCAKINKYIWCPATARLGCGIYADQSSTWNYLTAAYTVSTTPRPPVATPTSRDYMVHIKTDRGFTVNTSVTTEANAPSDADFGNGAGVVLNWQRALNYGVLSYEIYRKTGSDYVLLFRITNGLTTYIDNNSTLPDVVAGFPSADFTGRFTYSASINNVLTNLAIDGISPAWDMIPYALLVPTNYNLTNTNLAEKQWIRWNISGLNTDVNGNARLDIRVTDGVMDGTRLVLTSAAGQFNAGMVGDTIVLTGNGLSFTTTIATYTNATTIALTAAVTTIPSVTVEFAGTGKVNGNYVRQGTLSAHDYYNLAGTSASTSLNAIKWSNVDSAWFITDSIGTNIYEGFGGTYPWEVVTWFTAGSDDDPAIEPVPTVSQYVIPSTVIQGGAGLNSIVFDLAQLSYGANAIFTFCAQDLDGTHGIPPVTPNGSNQGGPGGLGGGGVIGGGDGNPTCVWTEEIVQVVRGLGTESIKAGDVQKSDVLIDANRTLNAVLDVTYSVNEIWRVTTANGFICHVTDTHKFLQAGDDVRGLPLQSLAVGDNILTCNDGEMEVSTIKAIDRQGHDSVVMFRLSPGHGFLIGRGDFEKWGGIGSHNLKPLIIGGTEA